MIAVNTSAMMAMALGEAEGDAISSILEDADRILISAATLTETFIVASGRRAVVETHRLLNKVSPEVIAVDEATARRIETIYRRYGRGFHRAALNFGDCFAYDVAREHSCPLLYVGNDFALTDIASALDLAP